MEFRAMTEYFFYYVLLCMSFPIDLVGCLQTVTREKRHFQIDYVNDQFLKDGEPFRYISGSLHYFRVPRAYWHDRLRKYRAAGLNAISTYIEWSFHEPLPGVYRFQGDHDVFHFIELAHEEHLLVILRPGPYICAERDLGGYPPWLFYKNPEMVLRTNDSSHTRFVFDWFKVLLPRLQPLLYGNGGPIIMVQVENEYGSYNACDRAYTSWLRDVLRSYIADNAVLFTTDGYAKGFLRCGPVPGVFATVDFGPVENVSKAFEPLREMQQHGPLVNSELYPGHLTHWGDANWAHEPTHRVVNTTRQLLQLNASFNYYMFHGGTNFHLSSGANNPPFKPQTTSYDFAAPISENGDLTEKYFAIKAVISEFRNIDDIKLQRSQSTAYGKVNLYPKVCLFDSNIGNHYGTTVYPKTFESQQLYSGLMLYQSRLPAAYSGSGYLRARVHDRAHVYVNQELAAILNRRGEMYDAEVGGERGESLTFLVENQGHINYGKMSDLKGLVENVTLNGDILTQWDHVGYSLQNISHISSLPNAISVKLPAFFEGSFELPALDSYQDTFVDMIGWGKGVLWVNEWCLGRYWPAEGPQVSLYLPGPRLRALNTLTVLELEAAGPDHSVRLRARPRSPPAYLFTPSVSIDDD